MARMAHTAHMPHMAHVAQMPHVAHVAHTALPVALHTGLQSPLLHRVLCAHESVNGKLEGT